MKLKTAVPVDPKEATENMVQDWEDAPANYGDLKVGESDEAVRVFEEADYQEELREPAVDTRARGDPERSQAEHEAMGWREPEPQDIGKVVFNRGLGGSTLTLFARELLYTRGLYLPRHAGEVGGAEQTNMYFDQAMKTRPKEAQDALWKEILKGQQAYIDSYRHYCL